MISEFNKRKLRFAVYPIRFAPLDKAAEMHKLYHCWRKVWSEALTSEMNVKEFLYADNYSRQSHVAALFHGEDPVGLTTLNWMDLTDDLYLDDSFFKVWPKDAIEGLKQEAKTIMTCCNVTLNFKYRQNALGVSGKDLLLALLVQYLKASSIDAIVAAVRLEKSMEKAAYRTGAFPIYKDLPYTIPGQRVDLVCWHKNLDLKKLDPDIKKLSEDIFSNSQQGVRYVA